MLQIKSKIKKNINVQYLHYLLCLAFVRRPYRIPLKFTIQAEGEDAESSTAQWSSLDTVYNGRCRKFVLGRKLRHEMFVGFGLNADFDVFFLQPGVQSAIFVVAATAVIAVFATSAVVAGCSVAVTVAVGDNDGTAAMIVVVASGNAVLFVVTVDQLLQLLLP